MPCFTAMRAEIALMSGSAFAVTHHAFSSGAGRTSDGNGSHASTLKSPSYTKSVSWQHYLGDPFWLNLCFILLMIPIDYRIQIVIMLPTTVP
ncbi:putative IS1 encoded protein [Shigella flexneri K-315]|uniref:Putative IS1 encoded protein n=1 Tax=Shigella flexneri K-315 TaxID=766150 RepID=I6CHC5_SHIFL|nr:putative IS1 encoded protein [Shigella flexneri K-315]